MKVTEKCSVSGDQTVFICDFSPPRAADLTSLDQAKGIDADFICVAYNPGRAVRVDSAMLAYSIKHHTGTDVIFNLATRDMNKLALQSHLLGVQMLGLENVIVINGDVFTERDLPQLKDVSDFRPTGLMKALESMNQGMDFRGSRLRAPTDFCIGGSIDLGRGIEREAALTHRKASSGAHFFVTQPVFSTNEISSFLGAYHAISGEELSHSAGSGQAQPVFFGLQVLEKDGIIFSSVPDGIRQDLDRGRDGTDIALELLHNFLDFGIRWIYLVPPILRGGARNYEAAQRVLEGTKKK